MMASKAVIQREKNGEELRAALQAHGAQAASSLTLALEPETSPDVEVPDMEGFQILLRRRLDTARRRLVAADEAHLKDLRRLKALRTKRDKAVGELRRLLARLRQAVDGVLGPGIAADALLLEGLTPRDPVVLQRTAARILDHLEERGLPRPEGALAAIDLAPDLWVKLLREPLDRLGEALTVLALEKRDAVDSLLAKKAAQKDYDRLYASTTRMLQEFFRYVGMDDLAATVRPRRRRSSTALAALPVDQLPDKSLDSGTEDRTDVASDLDPSFPAATPVTLQSPRGRDLQPAHRLALGPRPRAPDLAREPLPTA